MSIEVLYPPDTVNHRANLAIASFPPFYPKAGTIRSEGADLVRAIKTALQADFKQDLFSVVTPIENQSLLYDFDEGAHAPINGWLPACLYSNPINMILSATVEQSLNSGTWTEEFSEMPGMGTFPINASVVVPASVQRLDPAFVLDFYFGVTAVTTGGPQIVLRMYRAGNDEPVAMAVTRVYGSIMSGDNASNLHHVRIGPFTTEGLWHEVSGAYNFTVQSTIGAVSMTVDEIQVQGHAL